MKKTIYFKIKKPLKTNKIVIDKNKIIISDNNKFTSILFQNKINKNKVNSFLKNLNKSLIDLNYGWSVELILKGIGYKSFYIKEKLILDLGYSSLIVYKIPQDIIIWNLKTRLFFFSHNKQLLNNVIYQIKKFSWPEAYTGKGILLKNEIIKLKSKTIR